MGEVFPCKDLAEHSSEALAASERRFSQLIQNSFDTIVILDADGIQRYVSPSAERVHGYAPAELVDIPVIERMIHPEDQERVQATFRQILETGAGGTEYRHRRKAGGWVYLEAFGTNQLANPDIRGVVVNVRDITERKKAEKELTESQQRLALATRSAGIGIWDWDVVNNGMIWDEQMFRIYGIPEKEARVGVERWDCGLHPDDKSQALEDCQAALRGERDFNTEFRILRPDGSIRRVKADGLVIRDEHGKAVRMLGVNIDITERKLAEESYAATHRQYQQMVDNAADGIFTLAPDGRFLFVNPGLCTLLGYSREELLRLSILDTYPPDNRAVARQRLATLNHGVSMRFERPMLRRDGGMVFIEAITWKLANGNMQAIVRDVTEKKRAEEALERERSLYKDLVASQPFGVYRLRIKAQKPWSGAEWVDKVESNYALELVSDKFCEILGATREQCEANASIVVGSIHPEDRESFVARNVHALETLETFKWEGRLKVGDKVTWVHFDAVPRRLEDGDVIWTGILLDITQQKRAKEAVQAAETRYRDLFDSMVSGFALHEIILDEAGVPCDYRYIEANPAFERLTGLCAKGIVGRRILEIAPQTERHWIETFGRVAMTGEVVHFENYWSARQAYYQVIAYRPAPGQFACVFTDVTERKHAEEALRESEERYRATLASMTDLVFVLDKEGRFLDYHAPHQQELVAGDAAFLGKAFRDVLPGHVAEALARQIVVAQMGANAQLDYELDVKGKRTFWSANITPRMDAAGRYNGVTIVSRDMTEPRRLQEQLGQAAKMDAVGRLAGGVAHDFNNMLGAILGYTELAMEGCDPEKPLYADLKQIEQAAVRSVDLTRQLLAFARKQTVAPKVLDLNMTVEGMLKLLRRLIGEDIELVWKPCREPAMVKMDPAQLDQILANLCVNARDAIASGGVITIETTTTTFDESLSEHTYIAPGEYVLLAVSDNGCGMDAETVSHIFEPFFTTKEQGRGTGLGLATVYGVVKQNNGFINVYSEPGQGTTFKIYLPRQAVQGASGAGEAPAVQVSASGKEVVLLVEDEPMLLEIASLMIRKLGYQVLAVGSPAEALDLAKQHSGRIDLLMTDVVMPGMNGRELADRLLALRPGLKRLYMSGYTADVIAHHGVLDEGVRFIQKPFSMKVLTEKLREVLGT